MNSGRKYQKYAWLIFLFLGLDLFIPAYFNLSNPNALGSNPLQGSVDLVIAIFTTAITLTGYRRGKMWAWFALLFFPTFALIEAYLQYVPPYYSWQGPAFVSLLSAVALVLPFRIFFANSIKRNQRLVGRKLSLAHGSPED